MPKRVAKGPASTEVCDLPSLAKKITAAHTAAQAAFQSSIENTIEAGYLLIQAKEQVEHGQWAVWLKENTFVSARTARAYMQVARAWKQADESKRQQIAILGFGAALSELAEPRLSRLPQQRVEPDNPEATRREQVR